jgi:hypothetical protein
VETLLRLDMRGALRSSKERDFLCWLFFLPNHDSDITLKRNPSQFVPIASSTAALMA